ncbi:MAG: hypothetical protein AB1486_22665 [Planctomycetota bacterium]
MRRSLGERLYSTMANRLVWTVVFVSGGYYLLQFLITGTPLAERLHIDQINAVMGDAIVVIGNFAVGLGVLNVLQVHGRGIARRAKDWASTHLVVLVSFFGVLAICILHDIRPPAEGEHNAFTFFITFLDAPMVATVMSLLGFYIVAAAFRAFRLHSLDAAVMMGAAVLFMVGQDPIGAWLTRGLEETSFAYLQLPLVVEWLKGAIQDPVFRALNIGVALGAIVMALRIWTGLEKSA